MSVQNTTATLASDLAMALDPVLVLKRMGMEPDPWQAQVLRSPSSRVLLNIHRQAGKSTVTGVLAAHVAVYEPNSLVLLLSPGLRQSLELFKKALDAYHAMGRTVPADAENKLTLELANGSRIVSLPGREDTVRGYSGVRLLIIDEAARVADALYKAVRPMLAVSGGRLLALSTPFGQRGWFYESWRGPEQWERYEVPVTECPRISPAFLEEERAALGLWYGQEYLCQFLQVEGSVFDFDAIEGMLDAGVAPIFPLPAQSEEE
jgi:hypothetical protein